MFTKPLFDILLLAATVTGKLHGDRNVDDYLFRMKSRYFDYIKPTNDFTTCNVISSNHKTICHDIFDVYLKHFKCVKLIATLNKTNLVFQDTSTSITLILVLDLNKFESDLTMVVKSRFYTNAGKYKIILCSQIWSTRTLKNMARFIWSYQMIHFVFVCHRGVDLYEVHYNPFVDELLFFPLDKIDESYNPFPDKLNDIRGEAIEVLTFASYLEFPAIYSVYNYDKSFTEFFKKGLNASILYHKLSDNGSIMERAVEGIKSTKAELCLVTLPIVQNKMLKMNRDFLDHSYPHMMNNVVALVPKPKRAPQWKMIWVILRPKYFFLVFAWSVLMGLLEKYLTLDRQDSRFEYLLYYWVFLKIPLPKYIRKKSYLRASWLTAALFLGFFYDFAILKSLLTHQYEPNIQTVADLQKTTLPIYSTEHSIRRLPLKLVNRSKWKDLVLENKGDAVFITSYLVADTITKYFTNNNKMFNYEIMKEVIVPAHGAYICRKRSPYIKKIQSISLKVREFGVLDRNPIQYRRILVKENTMNFRHFLGVFAVLLTGYSVSMVAFLWEKYINSCNLGNWGF
ncbi:hypothetical protein GWI33_015528 [Rhynchophorus ferrugineus]|uniref:Ionotropic receptor n=1 Tax=Rhynchophorus ferrugineus TaxID=354439 RepID=A0A834M813_RHYFE|nr:hypothetical protein GWI33_015528 [Rhynchophorus ferrugineus]